MDTNLWQYNEMIQAGAEHSDIKRAKAYDENMQRFRNYEREVKEINDYLAIEPSDTLIDFGCGTGALTIEFAKLCKKVIAIDVAKTMLGILEEKALNSGLSNIILVNAGYLTYKHENRPVDAIITKAAFHHLPDFWKVVALNRMSSMLKPGGKLFISDVVFSFEPKEYKKEIGFFIDYLKEKTGEDLYKDAILHVREEFSSFDWILDEMIERTGFKIYRKEVRSTTNIDYYCFRE